MYRPGFGDCFLLRSAAPPPPGTCSSTSARTCTARSAPWTRSWTTSRRRRAGGSTWSWRPTRIAITSRASASSRTLRRFHIGEVWLPWTDNPNDPDADALRRSSSRSTTAGQAPQARARRHRGRSALRRRAERAVEPGGQRAGEGRARARLRHGSDAATSRPANRCAGRRIAGCRRRSSLRPRTRRSCRAWIPPADQRFLTAPGDTSGAVRPFPRLEIRPGERDFPAIVKEGQPQVPPAESARLHELAEAPADRLALALDNVRNNTSLVILFRYKRKAPCSSPVTHSGAIGNRGSGRTTRAQLLGELDFLKVAHHGSDNATPVDVVHALRRAVLRRWSRPRRAVPDDSAHAAARRAGEALPRPRCRPQRLDRGDGRPAGTEAKAALSEGLQDGGTLGGLQALGLRSESGQEDASGPVPALGAMSPPMRAPGFNSRPVRVSAHCLRTAKE